MRDNSAAEGQAIQQALSEQTTEILPEHQFTPEGNPTETADSYRQRKLRTLPAKTVKEALAQVAPDSQW